MFAGQANFCAGAHGRLGPPNLNIRVKFFCQDCSCRSDRDVFSFPAAILRSPAPALRSPLSGPCSPLTPARRKLNSHMPGTPERHPASGDMDPTHRAGRLTGPLGVLAIVLLGTALSCRGPSAPPEPGRGRAWFQEISREVGIAFKHEDGRSGQKYYVEASASGAGWLDFDSDGDLDLYLLNGAATPGSTLRGTPQNALYENRDGRFYDITERAGVGDTGYGMGICAGDYDSDGLLDFFITNYGEDRLFRNLGGGRFEEVSRRAGVADARWGTGCAFGDLDGDGDLDLYVAHYVDFQFDQNPFCGDRTRNIRAYCQPSAFDGVPDSLFINQGDGRFVDEGSLRGLAGGKNEKGFGVIMSDIDNDGDLDIYLANDTTMNRLYINDGQGYFRDHALFGGVGYNASGSGESGMGVDLADLDGNGFLDIFVTNYSMETNTLYQNMGNLEFLDRTRNWALGEVSYKMVGWGTCFFDYDNDALPDLAVANGHTMDNIELFEPGLSYKQQNQLFHNEGMGEFVAVTGSAGPAWAVAKVSRALAAGDWNNDGRIDLVVTNTNEGIDLLENRLTNANHWIGLELQGPPRNRFAIGARVELQCGGIPMIKEIRSGGSFLAQHDMRLHFGLGDFLGPVTVHVRWPDGRQQDHTWIEIDRYHRLKYSESDP